MNIRQLYEAIDRIAPFELSRLYCSQSGMHDNSGLLLACPKPVTGVLFSLDLSGEAIAAAEKKGYNCIVTHHPAIFSPLYSLTEESGGDVLSCAAKGIGIISAHLNLDVAEEGIDEQLMSALGGTRASAYFDTVAEPKRLQKNGNYYGRVFTRPKAELVTFAEDVKETLGAGQVLVYGLGPVQRVASFCGAGLSEDTLRFAKREGADTVVSSDPKHHLILLAAEMGLNLVLPSHYAAEYYGFSRFAEKVLTVTKINGNVFKDRRFL